MSPTIIIAVGAVSMLATAVTPLTAVAGPEPVEKDIVLTASSAFEGGLGSTTVQHDFQTGGVVLNDSCLIEDDGAGAGGTVPWVAQAERSPTIEVNERVRVKKFSK